MPVGGGTIEGTETSQPLLPPSGVYSWKGHVAESLLGPVSLRNNAQAGRHGVSCINPSSELRCWPALRHQLRVLEQARETSPGSSDDSLDRLRPPRLGVRRVIDLLRTAAVTDTLQGFEGAQVTRAGYHNKLGLWDVRVLVLGKSSAAQP